MNQDPNNPNQMLPPKQISNPPGTLNQSGLNLTQNQTMAPLNPAENINLGAPTPIKDSTIVQQQNPGVPQAQPPQLIETDIERYQSFIRIFAIIIFLFNSIYTEYYCFIMEACDPDGIENIYWAADSIPALFIITILISLATYRYVILGDKQSIIYAKYVNLLYFLVLLILSVVAFFYSAQINSGTKLSKWVILSDTEKHNYQNNINVLVNVNQTNLQGYGIFTVIEAVLFLIYTGLLHVFETKLPLNWVKIVNSRTSFFKEGIVKYTPVYNNSDIDEGSISPSPKITIRGQQNVGIDERNNFAPRQSVSQYGPGALQYGTGIPQSATEMPQSATGMPQYATGMPQYATGMPQYATGMPQSATGMPQYATGMPQYGSG